MTDQWKERLDKVVHELRDSTEPREYDEYDLHSIFRVVGAPTTEDLAMELTERIQRGELAAIYRVLSPQTTSGIAEFHKFTDILTRSMTKTWIKRFMWSLFGTWKSYTGLLNKWPRSVHPPLGRRSGEHSSMSWTKYLLKSRFLTFETKSNNSQKMQDLVSHFVTASIIAARGGTVLMPSKEQPLWEKALAIVVGVGFMATILTLAVFFPNPTSFQYQVFRIVLSVSIAGVAATIPGCSWVIG
jgi:hypothetical protein